MTREELQLERRGRWRTDAPEHPIRTIEDARAFLENVGLALMFPVRPAVTAPTFLGAYLGGGDALPVRKDAFRDRQALDAQLLAMRLLQEKSAFEVDYGGESTLLVSPAMFPYVYAIVGDRRPKDTPNPGMRNERKLAADVFDLIKSSGRTTAGKLQQALGGDISSSAVDRTLHELWTKLRIVRTRLASAEQTALSNEAEFEWEVAYRWAKKAVGQAQAISTAEALSAVISRYLETTVAATENEIEQFLLPYMPRHKVSEIVRAMINAREYSYLTVDGQTMVRLGFGRFRPPYEPKAVQPEAAPPVEVADERRKQRVADWRAGVQERAEKQGLLKPQKRSPGAKRFGGERPAERQGERPAGMQAGFKKFDRTSGGGFNNERGGNRPAREGGFKKFAGERPPRREGERTPRREGGFRKFGERGDRPPHREGERPSRREGGLKKFGGERPPRREGGFRKFGERSDRPPRREGERPPRREGGFKKFGGERQPMREGGFRKFGERSDRPPRREGERPPRREGGFKKFGGERPQRREGGFQKFGERSDRPPRREGERQPRREGGFKKFGGSRPQGGGRPGKGPRGGGGGPKPGGGGPFRGGRGGRGQR